MARSCAAWDDNSKDNACKPNIPAGIKCPPPSKTISPITRFGASSTRMTWPDCAVIDYISRNLFLFWDEFSSKDGGDTFVQQTRLSADDTVQVTTLLNLTAACLEKKLKASSLDFLSVVLHIIISALLKEENNRT